MQKNAILQNKYLRILEDSFWAKILRDDCVHIIFAPCSIYIIAHFNLSLKQRGCCPCPLCHLDSSATFFSMIWHVHKYVLLPTDIIIIIISIADPNPILRFREGDMILIIIWGHSVFCPWNSGALGLLDFEHFDGAVCTTVPSLPSSLQIPFQSKWPSPFNMWTRRLTFFLHRDGGSSDSVVSKPYFKMQVH